MSELTSPELERALEERMRALLSRTGSGKTICPSDVARSMRPDWRPLMEPMRAAARRLVSAVPVPDPAEQRRRRQARDAIIEDAGVS